MDYTDTLNGRSPTAANKGFSTMLTSEYILVVPFAYE